MTTFKSLILKNDNSNPDDFAKIYCEIIKKNDEPLPENQVKINVEYTSLNYKDALAITGKGKILKKLPLTPGIDAAGTIIDSKNLNFKSGDKVLVTGCNLGEILNGGLQSQIVVPSDIVVKIPIHLDSKKSMIIGTAGFTAMLGIDQLEKNGLMPQELPVLVTGASGGVGCWSTHLLSIMNYKTEVWSRKKHLDTWLKKLGATTIYDPSDLVFKSSPLEKSKYSSAIDNLGGNVLSYILPHIKLHGSVASVGLAMDAKLETTVFPFILRGVNLLGISSNNCPWDQRLRVWEKFNQIESKILWQDIISTEISLEDTLNYAKKMIAGETYGRILVKL